jgi:hypothetical protein
MTDMNKSEPVYGEGAAALTDYERSRLRGTVSPDALERFLVATGGVARRRIIVTLASEVLPEDLPEIDPELAAQWSPIPADFLTSDRKHFLPSVSFDLGVDIGTAPFPALWLAIEAQ